MFDGLKILDFLVAALLVLDFFAFQVRPQFGIVIVLEFSEVKDLWLFAMVSIR